MAPSQWNHIKKLNKILLWSWFYPVLSPVHLFFHSQPWTSCRSSPELFLLNMYPPPSPLPFGLGGTTQALWEASPDLSDCVRFPLRALASPYTSIHQTGWGLGGQQYLELMAQGLEHRKHSITICLCMSEWVNERLHEVVEADTPNDPLPHISK